MGHALPFLSLSKAGYCDELANAVSRGEGLRSLEVDIGRTFHLGKMPVKVMLEYDFYVINDSRWEPEHLFRLTFLPVIPSPFKVPILD